MWISLFTYFSDFCDFSVFLISEKIGVFALLHTLSKVPPYCPEAVCAIKILDLENFQYPSWCNH
jgi:hypothetical protein